MLNGKWKMENVMRRNKIFLVIGFIIISDYLMRAGFSFMA
jgi:hypothetical protein